MMAALPANPKAVIFDLWYTLICPDHHRLPGMRSTTAISAVLNLAPEQFASHWEAQFPAMYRHPRPLREYAADYLHAQNRTMTEMESVAFDRVWAAHDTALAQPSPEILEALTQLSDAGIRLGILSNAHEREIRQWHSSPLSTYFSAASFSCHIGHVKPERAAYHHVLEALRIRARDAIFVGDGASDELLGAREAGFGGVVFMRGLLKELRIRESEFFKLADQSNAVVDAIKDLSTLFPAKFETRHRDRPEG